MESNIAVSFNFKLKTARISTDLLSESVTGNKCSGQKVLDEYYV